MDDRISEGSALSPVEADSQTTSSAMSDEDLDTWRFRKVGGSWAAASVRTFFATAPGCPNERHGMRDCECRAFRTAFNARTFIAAHNRDSVSEDSP